MSQENLSPNEYNNLDIHTIYNSNPLSKGQIDYIRGKFKNIDVDLEVEKFKDYWSSKPEPKIEPYNISLNIPIIIINNHPIISGL